MNGLQIARAMKQHGEGRNIFKGVYPSDRIPSFTEKPFAVICKTQAAGKPGDHWVSFYVTDDDVVEAALKLAQKISRNGPIAIQLLKRAVHETDRLDLSAGLAAEASLFGLCFASQDQQEGMAAFLEKRRACFEGH